MQEMELKLLILIQMHYYDYTQPLFYALVAFLKKWT